MGFFESSITSLNNGYFNFGFLFRAPSIGSYYNYAKCVAPLSSRGVLLCRVFCQVSSCLVSRSFVLWRHHFKYPFLFFVRPPPLRTSSLISCAPEHSASQSLPFLSATSHKEPCSAPGINTTKNPTKM
jgi:hypothetical protein